jgi:hypothetical protein
MSIWKFYNHIYSIKYPNILISFVLAFTLIIYICNLYIVEKKNKIT